MADDPKTPAPLEQDEGEPQTNYLPPSEGGSYRRNPDGSLTRVEGPTAPPVSETPTQE